MSAPGSDVWAAASMRALDRALEWYSQQGPSAWNKWVPGKNVQALREALHEGRFDPDHFDTLVAVALTMYRLGMTHADVPPCNVGDAITALGAIPVPADPAMSWRWEPAVDPYVTSRLRVREDSAGIVKSQRANRDGWTTHATKNRAFIMEGARACAGNRLAVLLGAGHAFDLPLVALAKQFEKLILVDIDAKALETTVRTVFTDRSLRARVEMRAMDLTGINLPLLRRLDELLAGPGSFEEIDEAVDRMCRSYRLVDGPRILAPGERADLAISSCLLSQIAYSQRHYAMNAYQKRFGSIPEWAESTFIRRWLELELRVQQDHVSSLAAFADVVVLTSDLVNRPTAIGPSGIELPTGEMVPMMVVESLRERVPCSLTIERHDAWQWHLSRATRQGARGWRMDVEGVVLREQR